jgi:hypothetical protein
MPACATQIFSNVSPTAWGCLKARAGAQGLPLTSDSGTITQSGITIAYAYDGSTQTLQLTCTSKPFIISCGTVNSKIHELIDGSGCLGAP